MPRWMRGHGRCRGRPPIEVTSKLSLENMVFLPVKGVAGLRDEDVIEIFDYEVEAMKLVHLDGLSTDEAASSMGISKATFWRILESCRAKVAQALSTGKPIKLVSKKLEGSNSP